MKTGVFAGDAETLECLNAFIVAFDDAHIHAQSVAGTEIRDGLSFLERIEIFFFKSLQQVHLLYFLAAPSEGQVFRRYFSIDQGAARA